MDNFIMVLLALLEPAVRAAFWPAVAVLVTGVACVWLAGPRVRTGTAFDIADYIEVGRPEADEHPDTSAYNYGYRHGFWDGKQEGLREGFDEAVALETGLEARVNDALERIETHDVPQWGEYGVASADAVACVRRAIQDAA